MNIRLRFICLVLTVSAALFLPGARRTITGKSLRGNLSSVHIANRGRHAFAVVTKPARRQTQDVCGRSWIVAPNGQPSNVGNKDSPLDLATALKGELVEAGDTVWLHKGVYKGVFTATLSGAAEKPIVIRAVEGERATIDGGLIVRGAHTWVRDLEVMNSDPDRTKERLTGVNCFGFGTRLINLVIHDCGNGVGFWSPVEDGEVYGCLIYHNGWQGAGSDRGHGHAIYAQNEVGTKRLVDNIMFDQYGWGIHAYTEQGSLNGFHIEGNIIFNSGSPTRQNERYSNILVGGHKPVERLEIVSNYAYQPPEVEVNNVSLYYTATNNKDLLCKSNYFVGGSTVLGVHDWEKIIMTGNTLSGKRILADLALPPNIATKAYEWDRNTYIASESIAPIVFNGARTLSSWKTTTGFDRQSTLVTNQMLRPAQLNVFMRVNRYEPERMHVAVYNWLHSGHVKLDLSKFLRKGELFKIFSVRDIFGEPVLAGAYDGNAVNLSLVGNSNEHSVQSWHRHRHRIFRHPSAQSAPEFAAFIIEKRKGADRQALCAGPSESFSSRPSRTYGLPGPAKSAKNVHD